MPLGNLSSLPWISQLEEKLVHNTDYSMDHVLGAMLEEFDKGYELLRKMERAKRAIANIIDIGTIIGMCQYAT